MDWQPVLDAYSCIMYILSYISKSEHAMSQLLEATLQEAKDDNLEVKEQLKKMGSSYLSHREISAQEAVYWALSMPLKASVEIQYSYLLIKIALVCQFYCA